MPTDLEDETAGVAEAITPQAKPHLHDQVITDLRDMVMRGELAEGKRVPEALLCARLGISRTPLREALKVLAAEGFIELRPNRGAVVVPLEGAAVASLFELKGSIERLIGLVLPERITPAESERIEDLHRQLREFFDRGDVVAYTRVNHAFHAALAAATHNDSLIQVYSGLQQKILRARFAINERPTRIGRSMEDHEAIMAMLRAGASLDLAHRLEEHNRQTGAAILEELRRKLGNGDG